MIGPCCCVADLHIHDGSYDNGNANVHLCIMCISSMHTIRKLIECVTCVFPVVN